MSVKIEILDYKYIKTNQLTWSNDSISGWNNGTGITSVINSAGSNGVYISSTAGVSSSDSAFGSDNINLNNNHSYTISYKCSFLDNNGLSPSRFYIRGLGGGGTAYRPIGVHDITVSNRRYTFTMDASQNNNSGVVDVYFEMTNGDQAKKDIKIKDVKLINNTLNTDIDLTQSIIGELDVTDHSEFPLALTFQISEIQKVTSTTGDYSKSFKIPATKNNNKILNNIYIPNIKRDSTAAENKKCRITIGNLFSLTGVIKVTGIGGYGEDSSYYECVFYGNNLGWANGIAEKTLHDIEWGSAAENLLYNKGQITNTWNDVNYQSSTSPIVYPLTSYGDFNPDGTEGTVQLLEDFNTIMGSGSSTAYYGYDNNGYWINSLPPVPDWRPAIWVKETLEKIFSQTNNGAYKIVSDFMDSAMFKQLVWLLPNFVYNDPETISNNNSLISRFLNGETLTTNSIAGVTVTDSGIFRMLVNNISFADGVNFTIGSSRQTLDLTSDNLQVVLDEQNAVDLSNNYVSIKKHGYYNVKLDDFQVKVARAFAQTASIMNLVKVKVVLNFEVLTHGQSTYKIIDSKQIEIETKNSSGNYQTTTSQPIFSGYKDFETLELRRYFNEGDRVRISVGVQILEKGATTPSTQDFAVYLFFRRNPINTASFEMKLEGKRVEYGQTYNLKDVIAPKYTQIDFVKGIAHAFNLKMTTDDVSKTITIEPATTFYKPFGDAIDWTHKLDRSKEIQDKFLKTNLKRDLIFKYKSDDNDATVKHRGNLYFDGVHDEYPYRETLSSAFEKGESVFENPFFAGTYNARDRDSSRGNVGNPPYSALLLTANTGSWTTLRPDKGYEFLPRLLYWNKYSPTLTAGTFSGRQAFFQFGNGIGQIRAGGNAPSNSFSIYPQATSYDREKSSSPVLSYGNVNVAEYDDQTKTQASPQPVKGLYETYYKPIFEMFKYSPRLRTSYIDLKVTDVINLNFRKLIHIDGAYWILNKIVDYMPHKSEPTKVELVEWVELGSSFAASLPQIGSGVIGGLYEDENLTVSNELNNRNLGL